MQRQGWALLRFVPFCSPSAPVFLSSPSLTPSNAISSSPFAAQSDDDNTNDNLLHPAQTAVHLTISTQHVVPDTAVPSTSLPATNCSSVASPTAATAHVRSFLPLAPAIFVNCSPPTWGTGLCFKPRREDTGELDLFSLPTCQDSRLLDLERESLISPTG